MAVRWIQPASLLLTKCGKVCRHFGRLLDAQAHGRHFGSWFQNVRIVNPGDEVAYRVLRRAGGDGLTAHQMGEIRTESPIRHSTRYGVAVDTCRLFENLLPLRDGRAGVRRLALLLNPTVEVLAGIDIHAQKHQRVLRSAVLRALSQ